LVLGLEKAFIGFNQLPPRVHWLPEFRIGSILINSLFLS
jgi:hypothetical protein